MDTTVFKQRIRSVNRWWGAHASTILAVSFVILLILGAVKYHTSVLHQSKTDSQVSALSRALAAQQQEAKQGGTRIVTPPTSAILQNPAAVASSATPAPAPTVDYSPLYGYLTSLFDSYVAAHPGPTINYSALRSYLSTMADAYLKSHPAAAGPAGPAGQDAIVDYDKIQTFIVDYVNDYESSHPAPSGSPGAKGDKGDKGDPGPLCDSGFSKQTTTNLDGSVTEECVSPAPSPSSTIVPVPTAS